MSIEFYVLRILCSYSLSVLEARQKYEKEKDEKRKEEEEKKRLRGYQMTGFLKKKFEKNRDALTVLAPSCPVL
jgi:hypothetical protein